MYTDWRNNIGVLNVKQKEAEEKLKYKSLCIEIKRTWNMKCKIAPLMAEDNGRVTWGLNKIWKPYRENIIDKLEKTAKYNMGSTAVSTWNILSHTDQEKYQGENVTDNTRNNNNNNYNNIEL